MIAIASAPRLEVEMAKAHKVGALKRKGLSLGLARKIAGTTKPKGSKSSGPKGRAANGRFTK